MVTALASAGRSLVSPEAGLAAYMPVLSRGRGERGVRFSKAKLSYAGRLIYGCIVPGEGGERGPVLKSQTVLQ